MKKLNELLARIPEIQAQAKQRAQRQSEPEADASLPKDLTQLPLWPELVRAVPNGFLRSALFGVIAKGRRRYMEGEQVAALEGVEIRYTGQRLDQGDLDVWESMLHIVRIQNMGEQCRFTAYALLKLMGKTDAGSNRDTLHKRLMRLKANALEVQQGRYSYAGSLIDDVYRDKNTREYVLILNPKLRSLFAADQFTQIEWAIRRDLDGKPLAQWLHGFYASHAKPFPMKVETLLRLCGSESELKRYRQTLNEALNAVAEISATHENKFSYEIRGNLVYVEKQASQTQQRHLNKKLVQTKKRKF